MSDELTRKDIDDVGRRKYRNGSYMNRYFNEKRTAQDEYTGKKLYYAKQGKYTTKTTANVDHVVPIGKLKEKYDESLTKSELKDIANSDYNLAITSERLNKSKNDQDNHEYLIRQLKDGKPENALTTYNMLKMEVQSKISQGTQVATIKTVKNISSAIELKKIDVQEVTKVSGQVTGNAAGAGASAALMSMTVSGLNNIALVASGEKTPKQAVIDVTKDTGGSFISGAGHELLQTTVKGIAKSGGNKQIAALLREGLPIAEISSAIMIGNSIVRFIDDDISFEQCATEIIMNGAGAIAYTFGMVLGGPAGAIVASIVTAKICEAVIEYRGIKKMTEERLAKVNSIAAEALAEIEYQRNVLKNIITKKFAMWDVQFNKSFEEIFYATMSNDANGIARGLDRVLTVFGQNIRFKTFEEFDVFFMNENSRFTF